MGTANQTLTDFLKTKAADDGLEEPCHQMCAASNPDVDDAKSGDKRARKAPARWIDRTPPELHDSPFLRRLATVSFLVDFVKIAIFIAGIPRTVALAIPASRSMQTSPEPPAHTNGSSLAEFNSHSFEDGLHKVYGVAMIVQPILVIVIGLICVICILRARDRPPDEQRFLWLMTFGASISWWVTSATASGPSLGKTASISTWLALFAVYEARSYRMLRNRRMHLFTSLIGGVMVAMAFGKSALGNTDRLHPRKAMEEFVWQAVIVGPAMLTIWSCFVTWVFRQIEQKPVEERVTLPEEGEAVELDGLQS